MTEELKPCPFCGSREVTEQEYQHAPRMNGPGFLWSSSMGTMTHRVIADARLLAKAAHEAVGQTRKYTGEPYWKHSEAVANRVWTATLHPVATAAAWLHDVLEDTRVSRRLIEETCGLLVLSLVEQVTSVSRPEDGNRAARKAIDRAHLEQATQRAKMVKLADIIDNTGSIVAFDPAFARVYLRELDLLLPVLRPVTPPGLGGGHARLFATASRQVAAGRDLLGDAA